MQDVIQESEVDGVLNKRHEYFKPELGSFYGVKAGISCGLKYAKLASIDYTHDFPYLCSVIIRKAISIDGQVASPAKFEERRFNYSGVSEDGKSKLFNLSAEGKTRISTLADIDSFNKRSWRNLLERQTCSLIWGVLVIFAWVSALFANTEICWSQTSPNYLYLLGSPGIFLLFAVPFAHPFFRAMGRICLFKIFVFFVLFLNVSTSLTALISGDIDLGGALLSSAFLSICFILTSVFFIDRAELRIIRNKIFTIGSFNKFVTEDGKSVVITNKFGDDNNFPMEGYVVICPEIRNGDTVAKEAVKLALKWSYSGHPNGYAKDSVEFNSHTLRNTAEDKEVVLALFDKKYRIKSKGGVKKDRIGNNVSNSDQSVFFTKFNSVVKGLLGTKSGKLAFFVLAAWAVNFVFGYKLHDFLNYIIPALTVFLAIYGVRSKLRM